MTIEDAKRIIEDCKSSISFMATVPYGYMDIPILEERIKELQGFIDEQTGGC